MTRDEIDQMQAATIDRMETALTEIKEWADAYPEDIFQKPDMDAAANALADAGVSMDGLHGTWARHLLEGMGRIARRGLNQGDES